MFPSQNWWVPSPAPGSAVEWCCPTGSRYWWCLCAFDLWLVKDWNTTVESPFWSFPPPFSTTFCKKLKRPFRGLVKSLTSSCPNCYWKSVLAFFGLTKSERHVYHHLSKMNWHFSAERLAGWETGWEGKKVALQKSGMTSLTTIYLAEVWRRLEELQTSSASAKLKVG